MEQQPNYFACRYCGQSYALEQDLKNHELFHVQQQILLNQQAADAAVYRHNSQEQQAVEALRYENFTTGLGSGSGGDIQDQVNRGIRTAEAFAQSQINFFAAQKQLARIANQAGCPFQPRQAELRYVGPPAPRPLQQRNPDPAFINSPPHDQYFESFVPDQGPINSPFQPPQGGGYMPAPSIINSPLPAGFVPGGGDFATQQALLEEAQEQEVIRQARLAQELLEQAEGNYNVASDGYLQQHGPYFSPGPSGF